MLWSKAEEKGYIDSRQKGVDEVSLHKIYLCLRIPMIAIYCLCVIYMTLILKSATMTIESGITPVVSLYPNLIDYRCFIPYWVRAIVICAFKLIVENLFLPPLVHNCSQMPCWASTNYLQAKMLFLSSLVDYSVIIPHIAWHHQQNTFPNVRGRNNGRKV